jgi:replicative DNA helicase Mcm
MVELTQDLLIDFFRTESGQVYVQEAINGSNFIVIDLDEVAKWNKEHALTIINNAVKYGIRYVDNALKQVIQNAGLKDNPEYDVGFKGKIIPYVMIHDIASKDIGKLVRVRGLVSRTHFIKPMAKKIAFICQDCAAKGYDNALQHMQYVYQKIPFVLMTPEKTCGECGERVNWVTIDEYSTFIDSQEFSIQEGHEDSHGRPPQITQMLVTKKHLINKVYCGNSIEVIGVVRLLPTYRNKSKSRFYVPYVEVYDILKDSKDPEDVQITQEEEQEIIALSQEPNIYERLIQNVAPSIYGMEKLKEGALLSIVGGVDKNKGDIKIRGNIHVLCIGDAGMGKSQILLSATNISPKGVSSVGRGVSGAGLTAALTKDESTGDWVVEAGTLVLADNGLATVDEIDKMTENDRMHIHEAMEQQTVTIHKGGRHVVLRARTAVLAAANPSSGKYDATKSVFDQLKFPITLFSRFDLIFVSVDEADIELDRKVSAQILSCKQEENTIDRELLKKYISYAKMLTPYITPEAEKVLSDYFLSVRASMSNNKQQKIPITYRQLEGLRRMAEAHAKILIKTTVDVDDAKAATRIFDVYMKDIKFDFAGLTTDKSKSRRDEENIVRVTIHNLMQMYPDGVDATYLINDLESQGLNDAKKVLTRMNGEVLENYKDGRKVYSLING